MRIVAGDFRSRKIEAVTGESTRPTTDKVKEAVFSRIGPYFDGGEMLDLFAGSGNVSFEALSRGIETSLMCDKQRKAIETIKRNSKTLQVEKRCVIWQMDYKKALQKIVEEQRQFDFIYLDPPYKEQKIIDILTFLEEHNVIKPYADIVCETLKEDEFPEIIGSLHKVKEVIYGITRITYYKKESI